MVQRQQAATASSFSCHSACSCTVVWIWSHDELVLNRNRCPAFLHQLGHSVDWSRCKCLAVEVPRPFARHHSCSHIPVTPSAHARTRLLPSVAPVAVIAGLSFQLSALASMSSHRGIRIVEPFCLFVPDSCPAQRTYPGIAFTPTTASSLSHHGTLRFQNPKSHVFS